MYDKEFYHPHKKMTTKQIWEYDGIKKHVIEDEFNYKLIIVWESDTIKNKDNIIEMIISEILKLKNNV